MKNYKNEYNGVYFIINKINNKIYCGSSNHILERWDVHKSQLRNNAHSNGHLQRAWNKYGEENFVFVIKELIAIDIKDTPELFKQRVIKESQYVRELDLLNRNKGYNLIDPIKTLPSFWTWEDLEQGHCNDLTLEKFKEILRLLQETNDSINSIAKLVGISAERVYSIYHKNTFTNITEDLDFQYRGIDKKHRGLLAKEEELIKFMSENGTFMGASKELGLSVATIRKYCEAVGIHSAQEEKEVYEFDVYGNFITKWENAIAAAHYHGFSPCSIYNLIAGRIQNNMLYDKYYFSWEKKFKELNIYEQIMGRILNPNISPIVEYKIDGTINLYIKAEESPINHKRVTYYCKYNHKTENGSLWKQLYKLNEEDCQKILLSKQEGKVKIYKQGEYYE